MSEDELDEPDAEALRVDGAYLFERAVPVAGMLHVVHNCAHSVHETMAHWPVFLEQLKAVQSLLCEPYMLELFLQRCVRSSNLAFLEEKFAHRFEKIVEWRWGSVTATLAWLIPLQSSLQACWNPQAFSTGWSSESAFSQSSELLRVALPSAGFWAYARMLQTIQVNLDAIAFWCENCVCHEAASSTFASGHEGIGREQGLGSRSGRKFWRHLLGKREMHREHFASCPMRGKHAPELAAGELNHRIDQVRCSGR